MALKASFNELSEGFIGHFFSNIKSWTREFELFSGINTTEKAGCVRVWSTLVLIAHHNTNTLIYQEFSNKEGSEIDF